MDIYSGGTSAGIKDYEYVGGNLADSTSWKEYVFGADTCVIDTAGQPVMSPVWDVNVPKVDLDGDGNKEVVASYLVAGSTVPQDSAGGVPIPDDAKRWLQVYEFGTVTGLNHPWKIITAKDYKLEQNYPNPFNPTTTIKFYLPINKQISLTVYNALGQKIKTLVNNELLTAGEHSVQWDGTNNAGQKVASGMYIYELKYGNFKIQKRMTLLK